MYSAQNEWSARFDGSTIVVRSSGRRSRCIPRLERVLRQRVHARLRTVVARAREDAEHHVHANPGRVRVARRTPSGSSPRRRSSPTRMSRRAPPRPSGSGELRVVQRALDQRAAGVQRRDRRAGTQSRAATGERVIEPLPDVRRDRTNVARAARLVDQDERDVVVVRAEVRVPARQRAGVRDRAGCSMPTQIFIESGIPEGWTCGPCSSP